MQNTTNFNLQKPDYNNIADIGVLNTNFDKIDNGIAPFFVAALKSANVYEITTGNTVTSLSDGFGIRIAIPVNSTGSVSIVVDGLTAVLVKKPNGGAVSNFKANGVYALTYYNGNFILVSGGGCDGDKVTATEKDVLINKTYIGSDEEVHTGSMPELGTVTKQLGINETFSLGEGHINGLRVTQNITSLTGHQNATQYTYWPIGTSGNSQPVAFLKPPLPAYYYGDAWIRQEMPYLQPQYIVAGANIFGCAGSATIESLGGKKVAIGTLNSKGENVTLNFAPSIVFFISTQEMSYTPNRVKDTYKRWGAVWTGSSSLSGLMSSEHERLSVLIVDDQSSSHGDYRSDCSLNGNTISRSEGGRWSIIYIAIK